jgi:hypothetical protein
VKFLIQSKYKFLVELIFGLSFTFGVVLLFGSLYDTGDDLTMRNVSLNNSCELIWSKAVYGKILLLFPAYMFGFARYDFISFILLGLNLALLLNALSKLLAVSSANKYFFYILIGFVYVQFLMRPQFTNTAGLLAISGILNIFVYFKAESKLNLHIGLVLLLFSFWIRSEMTFVILFVSFPLLMFFRKKCQIIGSTNALLSLLFFSMAVAFTFFVEKSTYNSVAHESMKYKRQIIAPFFDYKFGKKLLKPGNKDILRASTLSTNDVLLFNSHFYDWPKFDTLLPYLEKAEKWYFEERDYKSSRLLSAKLSFKYFKEYEVVFLTLAILFFLLLNIKKTDPELIFFLTLSFLFAVLVFGWYGYIQRAFLSRLYLTPLFGLVVLMIAFIAQESTKLSKVVLGILLIANTTHQISLHNRRVKDAKETNINWAKFKSNNPKVAQQLVVFGGGPDIIHLNPVCLSGVKNLGSELLKSVGYGGDSNDKQTPTNRLLNGEVVYYAIETDNLTLLKTFFKEKFSKELKINSINDYYSIYTVSVKITN